MDGTHATQHGTGPGIVTQWDSRLEWPLGQSSAPCLMSCQPLRSRAAAGGLHGPTLSTGPSVSALAREETLSPRGAVQCAQT